MLQHFRRVKFGKYDPSTKRIIARFSDATYLIRRHLHPGSRYLVQPQFKGLFGRDFLQIASLTPKIFDFGRGRCTRRVVARRFFPASRNSYEQL